ncbi:MAG: hypothetical protein ACM32O_05870 [Clostridia bacterium]
MDDQRKKIIVKEIEQWRKNHLLPEHYCIFLLNLYTEGERSNERSDHGTAMASGRDRPSMGFGGFGGRAGSGYAPTEAISWRMVLFWLIGSALIAGFILLAFHFNDFSTPMQITIFSCVTLFFYILSFICKRFSPVLVHVTLLISFLLLLFGGIFFMQKFGFTDRTPMLFLAVVCMLFCMNGLIFRFLYLIYCGLIGFGLIYGYTTIDRVSEQYSWWMTELYWVPLALLMIGVGFLLHQRNPRLAGVLSIVGTLYFFGAELQGLYITHAKQDTIQLLLFVKIFLYSIFFFLTRQFWFSWLRL